ncbi:MAG: N-acetylmuramic acid 6-phosphate etherase [Candidatus Hydrogenedentes bacterium]|nr:N-acetylmuramic acid 6-phosphate etherase [Candidatus Hydrogenedentota bacterium]
MAWYLALEGGGTRTSAGLYEDDRLVAESVAGPSNPLAYGVATTAGVIASLARELIPPDVHNVTVLAGVAGVMSRRIAQDIASQLAAVPRLGALCITTDLHPLAYAHFPDSPGMLVIAGTGASILVHDGTHRFVRVGGRGPVMGDEGSAYQIAVAALRAIARAEDGVGAKTPLQQLLPEALKLADSEALIPWSLVASRQELAALARVVDKAAQEGDPVARACITAQARQLASLTLAALWQLPGSDPVPLIVQGSVIEDCRLFRDTYLDGACCERRLQLTELRYKNHRAVLELRHLAGDEDWCHRFAPTTSAVAPTEGACRGMEPLDRMSPAALVAAMIGHEAMVGRALRQQASHLSDVVKLAGQTISRGGRIIYMGAGTSGRLGVLDASECPPTFGVDPERVTGIMAGGDAALREGAEGAEDDACQGVADLFQCKPSPDDLVVGIAASGTTPYVRAALDAARAEGIPTVLLCCNPQIPENAADHCITLPTGAEVLPGSTRLNAGTATKVALNIISTGAMALSGFVYQGQMVCMRPTNAKLRKRAERMVAALATVSEEEARRALEVADFQIPIALIILARTCTREAAMELYAAHGGQLHAILNGEATACPE